MGEVQQLRILYFKFGKVSVLNKKIMNNGSETGSEKPSSTMSQTTFSSKSRNTLSIKQPNNAQSIEEEIKELRMFSRSIFILIWCMIVASSFNGLLGLANTKYIQSKLHGQPSDLASLDFFTQLVTVGAPIGALLMDNYYPFRRKIGPYFIAAQLLEVISIACIGFFEQTTKSFIVLMSLKAIGAAFTGAIVQGMLVYKTKMDIQILDLQEYLRYADRPDFDLATEALSEGGLALREERDKAGIKIYTIWTLYNALFGGFSSIWCGFAVDRMEIENAYFLATVPFIFILLVLIFVFKEKTEESSFSKGEDLLEAAKQFKQVVFSPLLFLPIVLLVLHNLAPDADEAIQFIMLYESGWRFSDLGKANAANVAIITAVVLSLQGFRETSTFRMLLLMGTFSLALGRLTHIPMSYPELPLNTFLIFYVLNAMFNQLSGIFTVIPIFGRLNTLLPKGFESTGANILNSILTLASSASVLMGKKELIAFGVVNGYYDRVNWPMAINYGYTVIICWLCPIFLRSTKEIMKKKKKSRLVSE